MDACASFFNLIEPARHTGQLLAAGIVAEGVSYLISTMGGCCPLGKVFRTMAPYWWIDQPTAALNLGDNGRPIWNEIR